MKRISYRHLTNILSIVVVLLAVFVSPLFAERIIITNGDFESGNSGFTSDYTYAADVGGVNDELTGEGKYGVGTSAYDYHSAWLDGSDHTTGSGLMFIANGSSNTSSIVWQGVPSQDLIIGQTYDFSAWIMDVYHEGAHASLTFKADAEVIGTLTCTEYQTWTRLSGSFTAGQARPVLTLTNAQSEAFGNDFAVDDLNIYYEGSTTPPTEAVMATLAATSVNQTSATLNGTITSDGGDAITARGFVYSSTDDKPYIGDTGVAQVPDGSGTGVFDEAISSLAPGTTYYYQAYATNTQGTAYGGIETFTTDDAVITFADGSGFAPTVTKGNTDQAIGRFQISADLAGASLTGATIQLNGTRTGLSNLKLWSSTNATFESGSDTQLDGPESDGASVTFTGFSSAIGTGGTYYFVTGDVASDATGAVQGVIVENASLTIDKGTVDGTLSNEPLSGGDISLPVDLAAFSARCEGRSVVLEWTTESETDNLGFILERKDANTDWMTIASWRTDHTLKGQGNCSCATDYSFIDRDVEAEAVYSYRLSDMSTGGEVNVYAALSIMVDALPEVTSLEKGYPNPFNPETYIAYQLAEDTDAEIAVFDLLGRKVQTLYSGAQPAGSHHVYWNGQDASGRRMPSGAYFIRLKTRATVQVQKVMLMK